MNFAELKITRICQSKKNNTGGLMFFVKLRRMVKNLVEKTNDHERNFNNMVDCKECGCVIRRGNAIEGEPEIITDRVFNWYGSQSKHSVYIPFYCKRCSPKVTVKPPSNPDGIKKAERAI